jgi:hypothetical protein
VRISANALPLQTNPQRERESFARNQPELDSLPAEKQQRSSDVQLRSAGAAPSATDTGLYTNQRVEDTSRSQSSSFQRIRSVDELPLQNRNALNTYLATAQVTTSQSSDQLAGVDIFV